MRKQLREFLLHTRHSQLSRQSTGKPSQLIETRAQWSSNKLMRTCTAKCRKKVLRKYRIKFKWNKRKKKCVRILFLALRLVTKRESCKNDKHIALYIPSDWYRFEYVIWYPNGAFNMYQMEELVHTGRKRQALATVTAKYTCRNSSKCIHIRFAVVAKSSVRNKFRFYKIRNEFYNWTTMAKPKKLLLIRATMYSLKQVNADTEIFLFFFVCVWNLSSLNGMPFTNNCCDTFWIRTHLINNILLPLDIKV